MKTTSYIILAVVAIVTLAGCKTHEHIIEVPVISHDTLYQHTIHRDSIYLHDSIITRIQGDTVSIERWHTRWRDRTVHDTIISVRTDTITHVVEVPAPTPQPSRWESFLSTLNRIAWIAALVLLLILLYRKKN